MGCADRVAGAHARRPFASVLAPTPNPARPRQRGGPNYQPRPFTWLHRVDPLQDRPKAQTCSSLGRLQVQPTGHPLLAGGANA
eukprot:359014-Chlamydomonas_euryale.AAC.12